MELHVFVNEIFAFITILKFTERTLIILKVRTIEKNYQYTTITGFKDPLF